MKKMKPKIVAILDPKEPCTFSEFNLLYHGKIDEILADPHTHIIISENFVFAAKYLKLRRFRNCTIYHIGDKPKHNIGNFKTKGNFSSLIELNESLIQDSVVRI